MSESRRIGDERGGVQPALAVMTATGRPDRRSPSRSPPDTVFDVSPSLAIEAARTRLRLFVDDNPEVARVAGGCLPECPLISVQAFNDVASVVGAERSADLRLQLDPWLGRTTSDPELRPDFASEGEVEGIPIVRCDSTRPSDGQVTRPALFAANLTGGVTFGDFVRLYSLEGILAAQPAGIGGRQVGSCFGTDDTATCVVLWSSRSLVIGMTLEGPPAAVNNSTAGAALTAAVPTVINSLAVVTQPAPVCSADAIEAATGVALLDEPVCADGWAFGTTVECPPPTTSTSTSTSTSTTVFTSGLRSVALGLTFCEVLEVFHVESDGWLYDGSGRPDVHGESRPAGNDCGDGSRGRTRAVRRRRPVARHRIDPARSAGHAGRRAADRPRQRRLRPSGGWALRAAHRGRRRRLPDA